MRLITPGWTVVVKNVEIYRKSVDGMPMGIIVTTEGSSSHYFIALYNNKNKIDMLYKWICDALERNEPVLDLREVLQVDECQSI